MFQGPVGQACEELTQKRNNHPTAPKLGTITKEKRDKSNIRTEE